MQKECAENEERGKRKGKEREKEEKERRKEGDSAISDSQSRGARSIFCGMNQRGAGLSCTLAQRLVALSSCRVVLISAIFLSRFHPDRPAPGGGGIRVFNSQSTQSLRRVLGGARASGDPLNLFSFKVPREVYLKEPLSYFP